MKPKYKGRQPNRTVTQFVLIRKLGYQTRRIRNTIIESTTEVRENIETSKHKHNFATIIWSWTVILDHYSVRQAIWDCQRGPKTVMSETVIETTFQQKAKDQPFNIIKSIELDYTLTELEFKFNFE
ncbi:MAG: hypothetical protein EZS28_020783 [Streblomastix strix]|uniref:Uncharacterized protein n=1 Tax=Streblomastix strix TaxID=222440 RepID=A0A5J4VMM0_9EUKA|nr:MAG: hypothetical protein EZS28_020783 [Streblomastix strix]